MTKSTRWAWIVSLVAITGAALVLVTHDAPLAERCGRHLCLEEGRIREQPAPVRLPHP